MYFDFSRKIDISRFLNREYPIYAHWKDEELETLEEHTELCVKYFFKIIEEKRLDEVFKKIETEFLKSCSEEGKSIFREMILNTVALHDIGKVNPNFQKYRMKNDLKMREAEKVKCKKHSMISAIVYIDYYFHKIKHLEGEEQYILLDFMLLNAYSVSRHHTDLNSLDDFKNEFKLDRIGTNLIEKQRFLFEKTLYKKIGINKAETISLIFKGVESKVTSQYDKEKIITRYAYERIMLSILTACDFYSTSEFMDGIETGDIGNIKDIDEFYDLYREGEVYKGIRNYEKLDYGKQKDFSNTKDINILRNELFLDAENKLEKSIDSNIFYLEAPTGSGKSNVAMNLSFRLLEEDKAKNKIFYIYPFNTLVEQNINVLKKTFEKEKDVLSKIAVINSVEPIKMDRGIGEDEDTNYEHYKRALLSRQFLNYPMVLTTHVTMFKYFFGTGREDIFPFHQLSNSVIVFDEVQSYRNIIWGEIATFLSCYAKLLNIKMIIMSATLPDLDKLSLSEADTVRLIENREKYFENPIFRDRVEVDFSLLESKDVGMDLYNHLKGNIDYRAFGNKKILMEFISKNSAYEFYRRLKEDEELDCEIELISGDDNIAERERIIRKTKPDKLEKPIVVVATQVIEAGVDIDMDIGYKNISILDSEEQFLGRINRSCKKSGSKVYFFKMDDGKKIYKEDVRRNEYLTLENEKIRTILKEKNFGCFYDLVIERLREITGEYNELNIENFFEDEVKNLDFKEVENRLKLINDKDDKISVYLSRSMEVRGEKLDGGQIWDDYRGLLFDRKIDYAKKRVDLSELKSKMNNFIYEIRWNYDFSYNDRLGDLFFIENGDSYFKDGKLDRGKFTNNIGEFI